MIIYCNIELISQAHKLIIDAGKWHSREDRKKTNIYERRRRISFSSVMVSSFYWIIIISTMSSKLNSSSQHCYVIEYFAKSTRKISSKLFISRLNFCYAIRLMLATAQSNLTQKPCAKIPFERYTESV